MAHVMHVDSVASAYARWAPIYDLVFGPVFRQGRSAAIEAADDIGGRILEVGVGTGISLPGYSPRSILYGIDISEPMLAKARERVRAHGLDNIEMLEVMDAGALRFPDNSFNVVVAQYVVTACPEPERALDEFARVVKRGGEIVITTRVSADHGLRGAIEQSLMPVTSRLGFRTEFPFARYTDWAAGRDDVTLIERRPLAPFGHFSLVRFSKHYNRQGN